MKGISFDSIAAAATDIAAVGTGAQKSRESYGQDSDNTFADLLTNMMDGQASAKMASSALHGGTAVESSMRKLGSMGYGKLPASFSGRGGSGSDIGIALFFMLMNMESDSGLLMLSSLLSAASAKQSYAAGAPPAQVTGSVFDTLDGSSSASASTVNSIRPGSDVAPLNAWIPANPVICGDKSCRSPERLNNIIRQFNVESSSRYTPHKYGSDTYCNIFVWDVTRALSCEIPHYVDPVTGAPRQYPDITGARELGANATYNWLENHGSKYGWIEVSAEEAQMYANKGYPAVTAWKNPGRGAGHVQIVCPSKDGAYDKSRGVSVAQAGGRNYEYTHASSIYSSKSLSQVRYYVHA